MWNRECRAGFPVITSGFGARGLVLQVLGFGSWAELGCFQQEDTADDDAFGTLIHVDTP